jgi:hypothetical protein
MKKTTLLDKEPLVTFLFKYRSIGMDCSSCSSVAPSQLTGFEDILQAIGIIPTSTTDPDHSSKKRKSEDAELDRAADVKRSKTVDALTYSKLDQSANEIGLEKVISFLYCRLSLVDNFRRAPKGYPISRGKSFFLVFPMLDQCCDYQEKLSAERAQNKGCSKLALQSVKTEQT